MFNLVIIRPDGKEVEESFIGHQTIVGRHEKCDLRLVDSMVSRNHCLILSEGKRFVVKDLESRNGTWVNGRRIKNRRNIKVGDVIQLEKTLHDPLSAVFKKTDIKFKGFLGQNNNCLAFKIDSLYKK